MAEIITKDIVWKKGETGLQLFELYDSDLSTQRNGTGKTYALKIWNPITNTILVNGSLTVIQASQGKYQYQVVTNDTANIGEFLGEIIETSGSDILKTNTFNVKIVDTSPNP